MNQPLQLGAVVVCGGDSRRMGYPKADLPWGNRSLIRHVCATLSEVAQPVVAAGYVGDELTGSGVLSAEDQANGRGPLEGLRVGLARLASAGVEAAFVTGCDTPLLKPAFVLAAASLLHDHEAVVPVDAQGMFPLAAVYRTEIHQLAGQLINSQQLSLMGLIRGLRARLVDSDTFRDVDAALDSLENLNTPSAYLAALKKHGLPAPPQHIARCLLSGS